MWACPISRLLWMGRETTWASALPRPHTTAGEWCPSRSLVSKTALDCPAVGSKAMWGQGEDPSENEDGRRQHLLRFLWDAPGQQFSKARWVLTEMGNCQQRKGKKSVAQQAGLKTLPSRMPRRINLSTIFTPHQSAWLGGSINKVLILLQIGLQGSNCKHCRQWSGPKSGLMKSWKPPCSAWISIACYWCTHAAVNH